MALLLVGIDEAGFGPMLGPLCVGMSAFLIEDWNEGDKKPCLWKLLSGGVCREGKDKRGRIAFADSKALKLPNDVGENGAKRHPLMHLERGVLAAMGNLESDSVPLSDSDLHEVLGAALRGHAWYEGEPIALPVSGSAPMMGIAANLLASALESGKVRVLAMRCRVMEEREFNEIIGATGNKGDVCIAALADHLKTVMGIAERYPEATVRVACDKLGGRDSYAPVLERVLPGWECGVIEQHAERSNYELRKKDPSPNPFPQGRGFRISFQPEAETEHLPVALASMIAKYVRELAMHRFNRYWSKRLPELKPTAGYTLDARRWLADAAKVITKEERAVMVRRA
ncbi:MAG: hypothetical protein KF691_09665 [Phycisphaeraceae bacterium]|nr:hypothetical protein [Phycisphaeraceae bacterium]